MKKALEELPENSDKRQGVQERLDGFVQKEAEWRAVRIREGGLKL